MAINIDPGDNWATKLAGPRSADVITVTNVGDIPHRPGEITSLLVDDDVFDCDSYAKIFGSRELTGLTEDGTYAGVFKTGATETGGPNLGSGDMITGFEGNKNKEDLFLNGKALKQITFVSLAATVANLNSWEWTWDGTGNIIYVKCSDPEATDQTLELAEEQWFINGATAPDNVTWNWVNAPTTGDGRQLSRLKNQMPTFAYWANNAQAGAFDLGDTSGWHLNGIQIQKNHGANLRIGDNCTIEFCRIAWAGQLGVGGVGDNVVFKNNAIYRCNYNGFKAGWEAGGSKFVRCDGMDVYGNFVDQNGGSGLWWDIENLNCRIHHNFVSRSGGIFWEINFGPAEIYNNFSGPPGWTSWYPTEVPSLGWPNSSAISVASCEDVMIRDNVVKYGGKHDPNDVGDGISMSRQKRYNPLIITDISQANPAVVTHDADSQDVIDGKVLQILHANMVGMVELTASPDGDGFKRFLVTAIDDTHFSLDGVDSTAYTPFVEITDNKDGIEWRTRNIYVIRNIIQCDLEDKFILSAVDDHQYLLDESASAGDGTSLNWFIANEVYDNPGTSSHFGLANGVRTYAAWDAYTNVIGGSITADAYVPSPVLVV